MCIQAIAGLLTGQYNLPQALSVEAKSFTGAFGGLGGAASCASGAARGGAFISGADLHRTEGRFGANREGQQSCGSRGAGHGNQSGGFERTTTQTHYGPDGSITQSTTHESSRGAGARAGHRDAGFGEHGGAMREGAYAFNPRDDFSRGASGFHGGFDYARGGAFSSGAASASGFGQFSASVVSIQPAVGALAGIGAALMNLLGGAQARTA
jgi:hypothetical protein